MNGAAAGPPLARRTAAAAILLGALADALLRTEAEWGTGFSIWVLAVTAGAAALVAYRDGAVRREVLGWLAVAAAFAIAFSWRDGGELQALTVLAILVSLGLARIAAVREPAPSVFESRVADVLVGAWRLAVDFATGFLRLVLRDAPPWRQARGTRFSAARIVIAVAAAAVVVLIFGALLAEADPVFAAWVDVVRWDFDELAAHILVTAVVAWLAGGALRGGLFRWDAPARTLPVPRFAPGVLEIGSVLGSVAAIFTLFIAAQIAWIAGGAEFVRTTTGLTFAEFARRGFFQLIVVAALLLSLLLSLRPRAGAGEERADTWYRRLAYLLIALFAVMVISAAAKLRLYVDFYALSVPRLYAAVAVAWLSFVFLWFIATVLRDRARRFAGGVFVSGFATLALLHVANPDLLVARYNLAHPPLRAAATGIDFAYLARLSADAVPALLPAVIREQPRRTDDGSAGQPREGDPCLAAAMLYDTWGRSTGGSDWRSWNAAEARARDLVRRHAQELQALRCERAAPAPARPPPA